MYRSLERYVDCRLIPLSSRSHLNILPPRIADCKKEEDTAISVINACQTGTSRGLVVVSHYRSFIEDLEDEAQQDAEDMEYYDYDY